MFVSEVEGIKIFPSHLLTMLHKCVALYTLNLVLSTDSSNYAIWSIEYMDNSSITTLQEPGWFLLSSLELGEHLPLLRFGMRTMDTFDFLASTLGR